MDRYRSDQGLAEARRVFPGGVNSPVRAFSGMLDEPLFIEQAKGAYLIDADGNQLLDYVGSWGPAILGHANPEVAEAMASQLPNGWSYGAPTNLETDLAGRLRSFMPKLEKMRFVSSGTEACMSALRLARGFTGRDKIIKFEGCYHGHADCLLVKAGSGVAICGESTTKGVPEAFLRETIVLPFNDAEALAKAFSLYPGQIAAVILEPIAGNMGMVRSERFFLEKLTQLSKEHGALVIFDEVMSGFRVHPGGATALFDMSPDLIILGKVVGGGMPVGVFGGRADVMDHLAPLGGVYQAGTLSGNPLAMVCGIATLNILERDKPFQYLYDLGTALTEGLRAIAERHKVPLQVEAEGGMFGFFFSDSPVRNFQGACASNERRFRQFHSGMLAEGIYLAPSRFEAGFVSAAHEASDIDHTLRAADKVFRTLR